MKSSVLCDSFVMNFKLRRRKYLLSVQLFHKFLASLSFTVFCGSVVAADPRPLLESVRLAQTRLGLCRVLLWSYKQEALSIPAHQFSSVCAARRRDWRRAETRQHSIPQVPVTCECSAVQCGNVNVIALRMGALCMCGGISVWGCEQP